MASAPGKSQADQANLRQTDGDNGINAPKTNTDYKEELDRKANQELGFHEDGDVAHPSAMSGLMGEIAQALPQSAKNFLGIKSDTLDQEALQAPTDPKPEDIKDTPVEEFMKDVHRSKPEDMKVE